MAIVKMKFVSAATDEAHVNQMLTSGVSSGLIHCEPASKIVNEDNAGKLINDEDPYAGYCQTLSNIAHSLNYTIQEKKTSDREYTCQQIEDFIVRMNDLFGLTTDARKVILTPEDQKALKELSVLGFERIHNCQYLNFRFGRLPRESFEKLYMYRDDIFIQHRLYENSHYIWIVYVTSDSYVERTNKIFRDLAFEPIDIPTVDIDRELTEHHGEIDDVYTYCMNQDRLYRLHPYAAMFEDRYVMSGFVQEKDVEAYRKVFEGLPVTLEVKDPSEVDLECPTMLKNNWVVRPFEMFLGMYGVPKYGNFDPTCFMAVTYCLLFGIMFGDLGQGLVLTILGLALEKKGQLFGIIGRVGITSMIFGFLFGSTFGNETLLNPIHQKLFGVHEKLFEVMDSSSTMTILIGAVAIGAVLILMTQLLNIVNRFRHNEKGEAIFSQNGIAGFVFYGSIIAGIVATMIFQINVINPVTIGLCIVLPIICFVMKEPLTALVEHEPVTPKEGWGGYIMQSIFELIDVLLTFVTNSMSYLRVGGFVLSHAGMMLVVTTLVEMTGNAGIPVMIFGNIFVMVLEGLIVGIQTLRLEYYEMFSRYYDAGGIPFKAMTAEKLN